MGYKIRFRTDVVCEDVDDDNIDVTVELDDGRVFIPTFFTLKNIEGIMTKDRRTGECGGGVYFWTVDMIIVPDLHETTIRRAVASLIEADELQYVCKEMS